MTDKLSEFRRINEPRVRRALEQIGFVEKSASSMKIPHADVAVLLAPIFDAMAKRKTTPLGPEHRLHTGRTAAPPEPQSIRPAGRARSAESSALANADFSKIEERLLAYASDPVKPEVSRYSDLPTTQLVDKMIAIGAILAERRK